MKSEDMKAVLDMLDVFIDKFTVNTGVIYLNNTTANREFVNFAKSIDKYRHIRMRIKDGAVPANGIRMRNIDDVIDEYNKKLMMD